MKKFKNIFPPLTKNKPIRIAIFSIPYLLILAGLVLASQQAWNDYESSFGRLFNVAKTDIENVILHTATKSESESIEMIDKIDQVQIRLKNEIDSYCKVSPLIGWQSAINQFSSKIDDCNRQKSNFDQILTDMGGITVYIKAERELSSIISNSIKGTNQNNQSDKWKNIESIWRQASTDILLLTDVEQFTLMKATANTNVIKIAEAWKQLNDANTSKDRAKFESAQANIVKVYKLLDEISSTSKTESEKLVVVLSNSYEKI